MSSETSATPVGVTIHPSFRYKVSWNYGQSECSFETLKDMKNFVRDELPAIEKHGPDPERGPE